MTLTCSLIYHREKDKTNICINHNVNDLHAGPYLRKIFSRILPPYSKHMGQNNK